MESIARSFAKGGIFRVLRRDTAPSPPPAPILDGVRLEWNTLPALHSEAFLNAHDRDANPFEGADWAPPDFSGIVAPPPATTRLERHSTLAVRSDPLRPNIEIERYLEHWTPGYEASVRQLARSIPAMERDCRATICIPVAATEEHFIGDTIALLPQQTALPSSFELLLLVNIPDRASHLHDNLTRTLVAIENARSAATHIRTHVVTVGTGDAATRTIGFLRALVTDIALLRHVERRTGQDHLLFRWDADTRGVDRSYIEHTLQRATDYPDADSFRGQTVPSPERLTKDPPLFVSYMFPEVARLAIRGEELGPKHGGPNHAIRASAYSAVHGYDDQATLGEDILIARALTESRPSNGPFTPMMYAGSRSRLYTSTRRGTQAVELGSCALAQWSFSRTRFGPLDEHVRLLPEHQPRQSTVADTEQILDQVSFQINCSLRFLHRLSLGTIGADDSRLHRVLRQFFGLRLRVLDTGSVEIEDGSTFLDRMALLADRGLQAWRARLAFRSPI